MHPYVSQRAESSRTRVYVAFYHTKMSGLTISKLARGRFWRDQVPLASVVIRRPPVNGCSNGTMNISSRPSRTRLKTNN